MRSAAPVAGSAAAPLGGRGHSTRTVNHISTIYYYTNCPVRRSKIIQRRRPGVCAEMDDGTALQARARDGPAARSWRLTQRRGATDRRFHPEPRPSDRSICGRLSGPAKPRASSVPHGKNQDSPRLICTCASLRPRRADPRAEPRSGGGDLPCGPGQRTPGSASTAARKGTRQS